MFVVFASGFHCPITIGLNTVFLPQDHVSSVLFKDAQLYNANN